MSSHAAAGRGEPSERGRGDSLAPLKVYDAGPTLVVGFGGQPVPDDLCLAEYREELSRLIAKHAARILAFDLSDVKYVPSGMLGLLLSLKRDFGLSIHLYNASADIRETLEITKLDGQFELRDVAV